jgi:hypothetical protein
MERPDELRSDPKVDQLKAEISENQADLQETVAAIQDRLSPAHFKDQAATTVRRATIGRMQHMMNTNNPMPYALIGIGAAWLLASHRSAGQWRYGNGARWSDDDQFQSAYSSAGHSTTSEWQAAASERADAVAERARRAAAEARHKWSSALNDNPIALGIAALAAGALVGSVLPVTETENEYLGETRDTAVESARSLVKETVQKAARTDEPI